MIHTRTYRRNEGPLGPIGLPGEPPRRDLRGDYITMSDAAKILKVNRTQVWRYCNAGKLPHYVLGTDNHPIFVVTLDDVDQLRNDREQAALRRRLRKMNGLLAGAGLLRGRARPMLLRLT